MRKSRIKAMLAVRGEVAEWFKAAVLKCRLPWFSVVERGRKRRRTKSFQLHLDFDGSPWFSPTAPQLHRESIRNAGRYGVSSRVDDANLIPASRTRSYAAQTPANAKCGAGLPRPRKAASCALRFQGPRPARGRVSRRQVRKVLNPPPSFAPEWNGPASSTLCTMRVPFFAQSGPDRYRKNHAFHDKKRFSRGPSRPFQRYDLYSRGQERIALSWLPAFPKNESTRNFDARTRTIRHIWPFASRLQIVSRAEICLLTQRRIGWRNGYRRNHLHMSRLALYA